MFRKHGVHVLGSFIFGLPSDTPATFDATAALAQKADITFAQFVMLTPFPGTVDFERWERDDGDRRDARSGHPADASLADPASRAPQGLHAAPADGARTRSATAPRACGTSSTACRRSGSASKCVKSLKSRLAFVLISKLYRQMYANTGIATDSARVSRAEKWARMLAAPTRRLFSAPPMPELQVPN